MEVVFREFRKTDLDAFFFLDQRCYAEPFRMQYNQLLRTLLDKDTVAMVISMEEGEKPLGGGMILRAKHWEKRMDIISLMVDEPLRKLGLGSRLMKWAEKLAEDHRLADLSLVLEKENEPGRAFALKNGFEQTDIHEPFFPTPESGRLWLKRMTG